MANNVEGYRKDLEALIKQGSEMRLDLTFRHMEETGQLEAKHEAVAKKLNGKFEREYQRWYTEASAVVRQLIPDRAQEFNELYKGDGKRKTVDSMTFNVQDWLTGVRAGTDYTGEKYYNDFAIVSMRFATQLDLLRSANARFESRLLEIRQILQADLFDSDLESARELLKNGFGRAAGALAGVVLEKHLSQVSENHNLHTRKKRPTINDFNEFLKARNVVDVPTWRHIQRLGDIRNICDHDGDRDPTSDEVSELIDGAEKFIKSLF